MRKYSWATPSSSRASGVSGSVITFWTYRAMPGWWMRTSGVWRSLQCSANSSCVTDAMPGARTRAARSRVWPRRRASRGSSRSGSARRRDRRSPARRTSPPVRAARHRRPTAMTTPSITAPSTSRGPGGSSSGWGRCTEYATRPSTAGGVSSNGPRDRGDDLAHVSQLGPQVPGGGITPLRNSKSCTPLPWMIVRTKPVSSLASISATATATSLGSSAGRPPSSSRCG